MKRFLGVFCGFLVFTAFFFGGQTLASNLEWKVYETGHFVIFFHEGYEFQAQQTAYFLEQQRPRIVGITGNERDFKTRIVIQDVGIDSNGYANPQLNKIGIFTNMPTSGVLSGYQNWFRLVSGHELTHIRHLLNYSEAGAILPTVFGDVMAPNMHVPNWIIEGITVYNESQISPYEGRLNDGYFDALIAAKAQAGKFPSILEANYIHNYFPVSQFYLFGGTFMRYLAETYGEEKITQFFELQGKNFFSALGTISPKLSIDRAAEKSFGKPFDQLFKDWEEFEVGRYQNWRIDGQLAIAAEGWGEITNLLEYNGKLYYTRFKLLAGVPGSLNGQLVLTEFDPATGREKELQYLPAGILAKTQLHNGQIYYLSNEVKGGFANVDQLGFGATGLLIAHDLATGKTREIFREELKAFEIMHNGEIIYTKDRKDVYGSEVWKFTGKEKVLLGTIDQTVAELEVYQDKLVMVGKKNLGGWNISLLTLDGLTIQPLVDTPWVETAVSVDGDMLHFSANYGKEWALYTCDLQTNAVAQLTEGGYAYNGVRVNDEMYFKGITADGEAVFKKTISPVPYQLAERENVQVEEIMQFAATLEEQNALGKNLSYMLIPSYRFIPFFFSGSDGIGMTDYTISMSSFLGFDLSLNTSVAQPLQVSVTNQKVSLTERETYVSMSYPLYLSNHFGLRGISVAAVTDCKDQVEATVGASFAAPHQQAEVSLTGTLDGGVIGNMAYVMLLDNSSLWLKGSAFNNYSSTSVHRGLGTVGSSSSQGLAVSAEYIKKLKEVRKGFWPSTLYMADIYGGVFGDYTSNGTISGGVNVKFELGMGYLVTTVPEIGVAVANDGQVKPYVNFGLSF